MTKNRNPKFFYGNIIVIAGFFILLVIWGTAYSFGIFFEPLLIEFGWTRAVTSGAFSLFLLVHGFLSIVMGRLNDRFGPRIVLTIVGIFLGLGYLLMSQISAIWQIYLFYGTLVAIGAAGGYVPLTSTISRWFVQRRGVMTGIAVSGIAAGTMIIPPVASRLISIYGWSTSYIIIGIIALVVVISAAQFLRRDPAQVGLSPHGEEKVKEKDSSLQARRFSLQEAIHTRQLGVLFAIYFCYYFGVSTILGHVVIYATGLGISAASAATILAIMGGVGIIGRIIIGRTSDRFGNKLALIISFILLSAAFLWLLVAKEVWMLYLFAALLGFGYGGVVALQSPLVAELFGLSSHGSILGTTIVGATIGGAIGPVLAGRMFDTTNSYHLAFLICAILIVAGLILTFLLRPISREGETID